MHGLTISKDHCYISSLPNKHTDTHTVTHKHTQTSIHAGTHTHNHTHTHTQNTTNSHNKPPATPTHTHPHTNLLQAAFPNNVPLCEMTEILQKVKGSVPEERQPSNFIVEKDLCLAFSHVHLCPFGS